MAKQEKGPFDGMSDEELQDHKVSLDEKIVELTAERNAAVIELGNRSNPGKPASLADCVNQMKKNATENSRVKAAVNAAASAAAAKAMAEAGKPAAKGKTKAA
jgi:hypothetical protein